MFLYNIFNDNFQFLISEIFLTIMILILILFCTFLTATKKTANLINNTILNNLIIYLLIFYSILMFNKPFQIQTLCNGLLIYDSITQFTHLFLTGCLFIYLIIQTHCFKNQKTLYFENNILILFAFLSCLLLSSSYNFIAFYLIIELQSLSFYILTASKPNSVVSAEAALKYFILGSVASCFILFGMSLIYGFSGTFNFGDLKLLFLYCNTQELLEISSLLYGLCFVLIGIFFKIGIAPFHMWVPDVYEGSPNHITVFFTIFPKIALLSVLIRAFFDIFSSLTFFLTSIFYFGSLLSIFFGSFQSLQQKKIKRLLAFSSISHIGFLLIGFTTASFENIVFILFYLIMYVIMSLNIWVIVLSFENLKTLKPIKYLSDLTNYSKLNPILSLIFCITLFSMAGIPPLSGFFAKAFLFLIAIKNNIIWLSVIGILLSILCSVYYIKLIKILFFENKTVAPMSFQSINKNFSNIIVLTFLFISFFIFFPEYIIVFLQKNVIYFLI